MKTKCVAQLVPTGLRPIFVVGDRDPLVGKQIDHDHEQVQCFQSFSGASSCVHLVLGRVVTGYVALGIGICVTI